MLVFAVIFVRSTGCSLCIVSLSSSVLLSSGSSQMESGLRVVWGIPAHVHLLTYIGSHIVKRHAQSMPRTDIVLGGWRYTAIMVPTSLSDTPSCACNLA
ncbi:hypothetical protein C7974DRAFT_169533 [Boeremia exigua]|uniref:uncharacterized protein n=1 Tax=Boeremia exigua TaxID=749465 RepID=UPI001E8D7B7E|nr:uncharacterized protein C7974DRAFT_169533 [Boeremia exigua]KAH6633326.1 hypothetical protein C7974DRAFT_169533 [Boeremia exigua]